MAVASAERGGDRMRERVTPSLGEARALADKYNLIPVSRLSPQGIALATKYLPSTNDPCGAIRFGIVP